MPEPAKVFLKVHIRWMIRRDMSEVLAIEAAGSEHPWTEEEFLAALRQRNCIGMVAERGDKVVGFVVYELSKARVTARAFAVHADHRRAGVGRQILDRLAGKLHPNGRAFVTFPVRETNLAAQRFLAAGGYRAVRVEREAFPDTGEDAFVMEYRRPDDDAAGPGGPATLATDTACS